MKTATSPLVRPARSPHRRGAVLILVALLLIVFLGFLGLAVDTLYAVRTAQQLQAAADSAALAAARQLNGPQFDSDPAESAVIQALDVASQNYAAGRTVQLVPGDTYLNGDVIIGRYHRQSTSVPTAYFEATLDSPNAVKGIANRNAGNPQRSLDLLFGPMFNVDSVDLTRDAVAMLGPGAAIIVLDPNASCSCTLTGTGTVAKLDVQNGIVQVDSNDPKAICHSGQPTISADAFNIVGGTDKNFDQVATDDPVRTGQPYLGDPLRPILYPNPLNPADYPTRTQSGQNLQPGYYPGGISLNNGTLNLAPGRYLIDGPGLNATGGTFNAPGVLLYIMDSTPNDNTLSRLYLGGNATIHISELQDGSIYSGLAIWQAYGNYADATILGTDFDKLDLKGTLYFPDTGAGTRNGTKKGLEIGGNGGSLGNQLITNKLYIHGTGTFSIDYDGRNNNMTNVFLVE